MIDKERIAMMIIATLLLSFCLTLVSYTAAKKIISINEFIQFCKANGYDGAEYVSRWSDKLICANYTDEEEMARDWRKNESSQS